MQRTDGHLDLWVCSRRMQVSAYVITVSKGSFTRNSIPLGKSEKVTGRYSYILLISSSLWPLGPVDSPPMSACGAVLRNGSAENEDGPL